MKKLYLIILSLLAITKIYAGNWAPYFEGDYIKLGARGAWCGDFTIRPKIIDPAAGPLGDIEIQARRFRGERPGDITSLDFDASKPQRNWVRLEAGGYYVRYDWAGSSGDDHYRIYCRRQIAPGVHTPIRCADVVEIADVDHNTNCHIYARKRYPPLNMNTNYEGIIEDFY